MCTRVLSGMAAASLKNYRVLNLELNFARVFLQCVSYICWDRYHARSCICVRTVSILENYITYKPLDRKKFGKTSTTPWFRLSYSNVKNIQGYNSTVGRLLHFTWSFLAIRSFCNLAY